MTGAGQGLGFPAVNKLDTGATLSEFAVWLGDTNHTIAQEFTCYFAKSFKENYRCAKRIRCGELRDLVKVRTHFPEQVMLEQRPEGQ